MPTTLTLSWDSASRTSMSWTKNGRSRTSRRGWSTTPAFRVSRSPRTCTVTGRSWTTSCSSCSRPPSGLPTTLRCSRFSACSSTCRATLGALSPPFARRSTLAPTTTRSGTNLAPPSPTASAPRRRCRHTTAPLSSSPATPAAGSTWVSRTPTSATTPRRPAATSRRSTSTRTPCTFGAICASALRAWSALTLLRLRTSATWTLSVPSSTFDTLAAMYVRSL
mmetsp:Transcript_21734/g.61898  ORF Transcript_21734/g.61898 Transcript_21734/m.61898 type:complete len:222 (-) Transcript_21734:102-767(-)